MSTTSILVTLALPGTDSNGNPLTGSLYLDPTVVVLSETNTDGSKSYLPPTELSNVIVFTSPTPGVWTEDYYIVAGVTSITPSDQPPQTSSLDIDAHPNPCVCVMKTYLSYVSVLTS